MTNEQPTKMWSGRFRDPLNATFEAWQRCPCAYRLLSPEVAFGHAGGVTA